MTLPTRLAALASGGLAMFTLFATTAHAGNLLTVDCTNGPWFDLSSAIADAMDEDVIVVRNCTLTENVVIENVHQLHIVGADAAAGINGASVARSGVLEPADLSEPCITIRNSTNVVISHLTLRGCSTGIREENSQHTTITLNEFAGWTTLAYDAFETADTLLHRNFFTEGYGTAIRFNALTPKQAEGNRITGNTVLASKVNVGIELAGTLVRPFVANNVVVAKGTGIAVDSSETHVVRNTVVTPSEEAGSIALHVRTRSVDSQVAGNDLTGLFVDAGKFTAADFNLVR